MIPAVQQNFPPSNEKLVDHLGGLTQQGRFLLLALFNRTGAGPGVPYSVGNALVAAGATAATALELIDDINDITSGSGAGAILFPLQIGQQQLVKNRSGGGITIYASGGGLIDNANSFALADTKSAIFSCISQNNYISFLSG